MAKKSVSVLDSAAYVDRAVTALRRLVVRLATRDAATRRRCERIAAGASYRRPPREVAKKSTSPSVATAREVEAAPVQTTTRDCPAAPAEPVAPIAVPEPIAVPAPATPATPEPATAPPTTRHVPSLPRRPVAYGPWFDQWRGPPAEGRSYLSA